MLAIAALLGGSFLLPAAQASAILEFVGADLIIRPTEPQPFLHFSTDIKFGIPAPRPDKARLTLQFAENENPTPLDRVYFRYDFFPGDLIQHKQTWELTPEARIRSGIEGFSIHERGFRLVMTDVDAPLPDVDYSRLCITLTVDAAVGSTCVPMSKAGNVWMMSA